MLPTFIDHTIKLSRDGPAMKRRIILLAISAFTILILVGVALLYSVFTEFLEVETAPKDASVLLDGKIVGVTPLRKRVFVGAHKMTIFKKGYGALTLDEVVVKRGNSLAISKRLPALVSSNPSGADVYINGEHKGKTPLSFEFEPGYHNVTLKKPGYETEEKVYKISDMTMKPMPPTRLKKVAVVHPVSVYSNPAGAKIYLWSRYMGTTPKELKLPTGRYLIRIFKEGYQEASSELVLPGKKEYRTVLKPTESYGIISVNAQPFANVYLDGLKKGETPIELQQVPAGKHLILLTRPGYKDIRHEITLARNQKINIGVRMDEWLEK